MMIKENKFVTLSYEMRKEKNGEIVDATRPNEPLEFIYGKGQVMNFLEKNLADKAEGDSLEFEVPMMEAYGARNEDMMLELEKDIFKDIPEDQMFVGNVLPMMDSMGRRLQGNIIEIKEDMVLIDFNHPLSGSNLFFTVNVIEVRDATEEEIEALNSHKCGGCSGCGSNCDSDCGSDCGSGGCGCH